MLVGDEVDQEVQRFIRAQRRKGAVLNKSTVVAVGQGIMKKYSMSSLKEYGGTIELTRH